MVTGTRRMNALVHDLLTYARVKTEVDRPSSISLDQDLETALTQSFSSGSKKVRQ